MKLSFVFLGCLLLTGCQSLVLESESTPIKEKAEIDSEENIPKTTNKKTKSIPTKIDLKNADLKKADIKNDDLKKIASTKSPTKKVASEKKLALNTSKKKVEETKKLTKAKVKSPQEQADVWDRISMQFSLPIPKKERIEHFKNWYLKNPRHLELVARRATPFLRLITEKIEEKNIPLEFALLPIVESSFDQYAYSHGNAAGLWQFVPDTGRRFGLEQNWWYDGRRDVVKSTDAAIELLIYLNKKFKGDWLHALASYNTGEGRVFRAIRNNREAGKPTDFWSLQLPRETSDYVPKLLAVVDLIKNKKKYGINLPAIANEPHVQLVSPDTQFDLSIAAQYAGISLTQLQDLNPAYNHWSTSPNGPYHLLLPVNSVNQFKENLKEKGSQGFDLTRYKVKSGDSLSLIAQRYNTSVSSIKRTNNLKKSGIRIGQYLMIPTLQEHPEILTKSVFDKMKKREAKATGNIKYIYTVRSGDSLWTIAKDRNISIADITRWNNLNKDNALIKGQKITLYKNKVANTIAKTRKITYKIKDGDSLSVIAYNHKVSISDLKRWNSLKNDIIKPGQKLTLHVQAATA